MSARFVKKLSQEPRSGLVLFPPDSHAPMISEDERQLLPTFQCHGVNKPILAFDQRESLVFAIVESSPPDQSETRLAQNASQRLFISMPQVTAVPEPFSGKISGPTLTNSRTESGVFHEPHRRIR